MNTMSRTVIVMNAIVDNTMDLQKRSQLQPSSMQLLKTAVPLLPGKRKKSSVLRKQANPTGMTRTWCLYILLCQTLNVTISCRRASLAGGIDTPANVVPFPLMGDSNTGSVTILKSDLTRLEPGRWLSDSNMDFWIRFW
jgi:hypothetical protein